MKKHLFLCTLTLALLTGCNSAYKLATSTRQDLQVKLRYTPTLVNLQVQPERITATCTNAELESLNTEKANQTVVAKALASAKADILLAPVFSTEKDEKGKRLSLTVTGYAATITSATTIPTSYYPFLDTIGISTQKVSNKITRNSVTVADIALAAKQTIKLDASDLVGLNEEAALKLATQKLLIREGADFLYQSQYSVTSQSGLTSFTLTAFPARYVNYRTITGEEARVLQPSSKPAFYFNTVADVQTVADRISLKFKTNSANASEVQEMARAAALKKYNADFLLNEKFYFDRDGKTITRVYIIGTPAKYANFHACTPDDIIDWKQKKSSEDTGREEEEKPGLLQSILNIFIKK